MRLVEQNENENRRSDMKHMLVIAFVALGICLGIMPSSAIAEEAKAKTCRVEQQCKWVNFKKVCTYVKVCR
jgi:uncharacterized membrane protein